MTEELPASVGAKLLDINRTSIYYKNLPISEEELECKAIIDHLHTDNPTWGARQMSAQLKNRGYHVGRRKARRYMNEMDIYPIYPNPDKPEKLFLFSTPCVILKKKGVFICYSLINTLIKFMASLPVMTA